MPDVTLTEALADLAEWKANFDADAFDKACADLDAATKRAAAARRARNRAMRMEQDADEYRYERAMADDRGEW